MNNKTIWIKARINQSEARELASVARQERLSRSQLIARILNEWREQRIERKRLAAERQLGGVSA
jgi:hypothetical protein